jgi:hypothetical protein
MYIPLKSKPKKKHRKIQGCGRQIPHESVVSKLATNCRQASGGLHIFFVLCLMTLKYTSGCSVIQLVPKKKQLECIAFDLWN